MTDKEIERLKKTLPCYVGCLKDMTREQIVLRNELFLRRYINSCLIYSMEYGFIENGVINPKLKEGVYPYINEYLSEERAMEIYLEQKESFKKAKVSLSPHTDGEGGVYMSCDWGD